MGWFREFRAEIKARRAGRKFVPNDIRRSAREITGPTGWVLSRHWKALDSHGEAYLKSFDPRIPPSLHISQRDATRYNMPIPLVERCVEDWGKESGAEPEATEVDTSR